MITLRIEFGSCQQAADFETKIKPYLTCGEYSQIFCDPKTYGVRLNIEPESIKMLSEVIKGHEKTYQMEDYEDIEQYL